VLSDTILKYIEKKRYVSFMKPDSNGVTAGYQCDFRCSECRRWGAGRGATEDEATGLAGADLAH